MDCTHSKRVDAKWVPGVHEVSPFPVTVTVSGERLRRDWWVCPDCGIRLERARVLP